jgi:hypothetical protein
MENKQDHGDQEQEVNEAARDVKREAAAPDQEEKNGDD